MTRTKTATKTKARKVSNETIDKLFYDLKNIDPHLIGVWAREIRKQIYSLAKITQPGSPFVDAPKYNKQEDRGKFWVSRDPDGLSYLGIAPNAARVRGSHAPKKKYIQSQPYTAFFGDRFVRMHTKQLVSPDAGIITRTAYYKGSPLDTYGFFGAKGEIFSKGIRAGEIVASPAYAQLSFADWLSATHTESIERIIEDTGIEILRRHTQQ